MITKHFVRDMLNITEKLWVCLKCPIPSYPLYEGLWKRFEINVVNGNSNGFERNMLILKPEVHFLCFLEEYVMLF